MPWIQSYKKSIFCGFTVKENASKLITYLAWLLLALKSEKKGWKWWNISKRLFQFSQEVKNFTFQLSSNLPQNTCKTAKKCRTAERVKSCIQSKTKEECFKNTGRRGDVMYSDKREEEWFRGSSRKEWMNIVNLLAVAVFGSEIRRKGEKNWWTRFKVAHELSERLWCEPARLPKMVGSSRN